MERKQNIDDTKCAWNSKTSAGNYSIALQNMVDTKTLKPKEEGEQINELNEKTKGEVEERAWMLGTR
ncbi:unnamed protein product [Dovyalis caffra]|uniref:Uncharacterized protein n=1 Tax=Dovyalis caffra TaxID=77055 RepID=A0AAV1RT98_9ROSI|nr:unnamed protein product [Dovyalis caffra]